MIVTEQAMASISPCFIVNDLAQTIAFYRESLGFDVTCLEPEPDPFFAIVKRDGVMIFLKHVAEEVGPQPNHGRHPWAGWDAYVYSPDPDALAAEISARPDGLTVSAGDTSEGLRGFTVVDPNGYMLFFGRPN